MSATPEVPDAPAYILVDGWLKNPDGTPDEDAAPFLCLACGGVVWDRERHQTLHAALKALLLNAFPGVDE